MQLARGDVDAALAPRPTACRGNFQLGGQEQFYLEGQIAYAPRRRTAPAAAQLHPAPQRDAAGGVARAALARPPGAGQLPPHGRRLRRQGIAVGPVRLQWPRWRPGSCNARSSCARTATTTFLITGKRHGFHFRWRGGPRRRRPHPGASVEMVSNAGFSADLSAPVMTRALCHFDNAYWIPRWTCAGYCARTHTQSNTAFRGFGGPQGALAIEVIIDDIARRWGATRWMCAGQSSTASATGAATTPTVRPEGGGQRPAPAGG
jgi:xanthine dehydrogenase large subunit